jgi:hypothetical protein
VSISGLIHRVRLLGQVDEELWAIEAVKHAEPDSLCRAKGKVV